MIRGNACRIGVAVVVVGGLGLAGCIGVLSDPTGTRGPGGGVTTGTGITLEPPDGIGERALQCEADYAPLRRLSSAEYDRTIRDLFPSTTVPASTLPADPRGAFFSNNVDNTAVAATRGLVVSQLESAEDVASGLTAGIVASLGCADEACFRGFIDDLAPRVYRRPLSDAELTAYHAILGTVSGRMDLAVEFALATLLQSPDFLYRPEFGVGGAMTPYEVASRLSYFLWGTMPDAALFDAAAANALRGDSLRTEVDRMLQDPRAQEGLIAASSEWLHNASLETVPRDAEFDFNAEVRTHLRQSLERFLWERVFNGDAGLDAFYTADGAYVDSTIGPVFGINDAGPELEWRTLPDRSGVLTHPAMLASHVGPTEPALVRRGKFVLEEMLCDPVGEPDANALMAERPTIDDSGRELTNRESMDRLTAAAPCNGCHIAINPLGAAFERYDAIGAVRELDHGNPIDTSGATSGFSLTETLEYDDAHGLTQQLSALPRARACLIDRWVRYATGGGSLAYDPCLRADLQEVAERPGASLREVIIALAIDPRFSDREVVQ